jgi:DNA polymerase III subunit epsilon
MLLSKVTFVVTDTETTGTNAEKGRIIELGAVRVRGGEIVDRFSELINPGMAVPGYITRLTGISTGMLFGKPRAEEVVPRFMTFLDDGVFAAHNLSFDLGFVNGELYRCRMDPLTRPAVCTLRLARRLLPGLSSKSLGAVADFLNIRITARHRALGDAEATGLMLIDFLRRLQRDHGITTLDELLLFQNSRYARGGVRASKSVGRIRDHILPTLPEAPGVYFMKDAAGEVIYIGKAKDLSSRVRSYFNAIEAHPPRLRKLVEAVRDIEWEETGSEIAALLLESRLIKKQQPRFNRAQKSYRNRPFIRLAIGEAFPRVSWTPYLLNDGAEYFGPVNGKKHAEEIVSLINMAFQLRKCDDATFERGVACLYASMGQCGAPCEGGEAAAVYAGEVERVRTFLRGVDVSALERMQGEMREAAARLDFETAARLRDGIRRVEDLLGRQRCVATPVLEHDAVIVQPATGGRADLFVIRYGRLVNTLTVERPLPEEGRAELLQTLTPMFDGQDGPPVRYFKEQADEIRILAQWMYANRESTSQVVRRPGEAIGSLLERLDPLLTTAP